MRAADDPSWAALAPGIGYHASLSARCAENLSTVLACTNAIASAIGSIPALIYRRDADGNRTEVTSHPVARLCRGGANPGMSWPDLFEHWIASAVLTGNGLLSGLRWLPWGEVTAVELPSGRLAFDHADGRGRTRRYLDTEVLHLRDRTDDGKIGRSRLSRAAETVQAAHAANTASSFAATPKPGGMLTRSRLNAAFWTRTRCARLKAGIRALKAAVGICPQLKREVQMPDLTSLEETKLFLRVDGDDEDATIALLIASASAAVLDVASGWQAL